MEWKFVHVNKQPTKTNVLKILDLCFKTFYSTNKHFIKLPLQCTYYYHTLYYLLNKSQNSQSLLNAANSRIFQYTNTCCPFGAVPRRSCSRTLAFTSHYFQGYSQIIYAFEHPYRAAPEYSRTYSNAIIDFLSTRNASKGY